MDLQLIISILTFALLIVIVILLLINRKKSEIESVKQLLKENSEEQRKDVRSQIEINTTEQFNRFNIISTEIQNTLSTNREETNKQLSVFQDAMTSTLEKKMESLQESNEKKLDKIQGIVDEKLQKTLNARLAQSFEIVNKQLESVGQGLGEMKALAADAKSLKNALMNVKERGTYGEVRLEKLLSDILAPNQYELNCEIADGKRVEFAIKLPGNSDKPVLLPIDSKFPIADYNRLLDAQDKKDIDAARKALTEQVKKSAKDIHDKYIVPPKTTNFALMFMPTEGLYAEVVQNVALFEELRDKYKVTVVGATTLSAYLASLQMGFKTLAIEKRSQEVWETLGAVKTEFAKFEDDLVKAQKQIQTADKTISGLIGTRTKAMNRKLRNVEELTGEDTSADLLLDATDYDQDNQ